MQIDQVEGTEIMEQFRDIQKRIKRAADNYEAAYAIFLEDGCDATERLLNKAITELNEIQEEYNEFVNMKKPVFRG